MTEAEVSEACELAGLSPKVVSLTPRSLEDIACTFETVGGAIGVPEEGVRLATGFRAAATPAMVRERKLVAVVEWLKPAILAGLWTPEMIVAAGGAPFRAVPRQRAVRSTWAEIRDAHPDLLVISPCSFPVERTVRELKASPDLLAEIRRVNPPLGTYVADEGYFSRPGPRIAHGTTLLRHLLARDDWTPPMPVRSLEELGTVSA